MYMYVINMSVTKGLTTNKRSTDICNRSININVIFTTRFVTLIDIKASSCELTGSSSLNKVFLN